MFVVTETGSKGRTKTKWSSSNYLMRKCLWLCYYSVPKYLCLNGECCRNDEVWDRFSKGKTKTKCSSSNYLMRKCLWLCYYSVPKKLQWEHLPWESRPPKTWLDPPGNLKFQRPSNSHTLPQIGRFFSFCVQNVAKEYGTSRKKWVVLGKKLGKRDGDEQCVSGWTALAKQSSTKTWWRRIVISSVFKRKSACGL